MKKNIIIKQGSSAEIDNFWQLMGPYIASRGVVEEIGDCIYDDADTCWFVAHDNLWNLIGFCAVRMKQNKCIFGSTYVIKNYRNIGIYSKMLEKQIRFVEAETESEKIETTTKNDFLIKILKRHGFFIHHSKGRYNVMYKTLTLDLKL